MISDDDADAELLAELDKARTPHGTVDNVMRVHSLRPRTMAGHVKLYRAALHDSANSLPAWLQETIASYVSMINHCDYSLANHWANARYLIDDHARADAIEAALQVGAPEQVFDGRELALLQYAEKLTREVGAMTQDDVIALRGHGLDDGQILEANQIIAYFNYVNRLLNGLGVTTEGDTVGYYATE